MAGLLPTQRRRRFFALSLRLDAWRIRAARLTCAATRHCVLWLLDQYADWEFPVLNAISLAEQPNCFSWKKIKNARIVNSYHLQLRDESATCRSDALVWRVSLL